MPNGDNASSAKVYLQRIEQTQELAPEGVPHHWPTLGVDKD